MRITRRTKAIAFFIALGACLVALAIALNVGWMIFNWRQAAPLVLGIILFPLLIAGLVMNTIFLVREIRRNEQRSEERRVGKEWRARCAGAGCMWSRT